ncbi:hypothetical protein RI367_000367 [Sorochytrium milnesiophthora]
MATAHAPSVPRQEGVAGRQPRLAHKSERGAAELAGQVRQNKGGKATGQQSAQRQQRQQQYGLDCTDVVHFSQWEVNGEYTKQFTIKNVAMKTQKLRYKLPKSRIFSLDFPDAATLSAGMSWHITVTFRPSAKQEYDDSIEIVTSFGTFAIPLKATLPKHQLTFDQLLSFAFCPLLETAKQRFTLRNTGELPSTFEWAVERPFRIVPDKGELLPGGEAHLIAEFHPEAAYCLEAAATCTFGNRASWRSSKSSRSMQLTGVGKYPHLTITADEPDSGDCHVGAVHFSFGDVLVQSSYTRQFVLRNASPVRFRMSLRCALDHQAGCFRCSTSGGVVPANSSMSLSITFTPTSVNASITERFVLQTSAGRRVQFSVGGRGLGAHVSISTTHLSFGEVELDSVGSKVLHIENHQKTPAHFQFLVEPMATFQFDKTSGTLPAQASAVITVHFAPSEPMNYCRSVYCLVEHQEPLTVNLLGTGYIANRRPYALTVTSLQRYRERVHKGLALYAPEQLESMIKSGWLEWRGNTLVWMRTPPPQIVERKHDDLNACEALFTVAAVSQDPAVIVEELVNFGSCTRYRYIEARAVHLRNNTKAKMTCAWQLPQLSDSNAPVFSVTPPMADLPPSGTVEFRVAFQPGQDGEYYEQQLECHVFFKNMRNFRFVNDDTFTPPWCLTISAVGNTAAGGQEGLVPQITFGTDDLDFVGCLVGQSTYRTMSVTNNGDTTVKCAFADWIDPEHNNTEAAPVFSARPSFRTLRPGERQLVLFRFSPQREHRYDCKLKCTFNDSTANYQWCIPETYEDTVQVQPRSGVLEPNNTVVSACLFTPQDKRKYVVNISLQYSATEGEGQSTKKVSTTVLGEGAVAVVTCHPAAKQLNAVLVGAVEQSNFVTLENTGACDVHMALDIVDANGHAQDEIRCVGNTATVQRRSKLRVYLLVNIKDAKKTTFQLRYRIQSATQPIEIEPWADPGEYSEEKLHHAYVVENKIFQVEPKVSKENHGYAIFQCLRSQGHIEPGGRDMLQVIFSPAECRQYCIDVPIFVQDHLPTVVTLKAQGVLARSVERVLAPSTHDAFFDAPADVQPLRVSTHTVTFGKVVLHSVERQLIALTNITDSATMFRWQVAPGPVSIFPESGTLQPQAHIYCRVVCAPTTQPRIYDIDCSCTMVNAEQQARYDSWATAAESQRKARGGSPSLEQLPTGAKGRTVGKLKRTDMKSKYAALPPISPTSSRADLHSAGPRHGSSTPAVDAILSQPAQPKTFRTHVIVQVESTTGYTPSDEVFERPIQVIEEVPDPAFCVTVSEAMAELLEDAFHDLQVGQQASAIVAAKPSLDEIFGRVMSATQDESRRAARAVFFGSVPAHTLAADPAVQAELEDLLEECIYDTTLATFMQSG